MFRCISIETTYIYLICIRFYFICICFWVCKIPRRGRPIKKVLPLLFGKGVQKQRSVMDLSIRIFFEEWGGAFINRNIYTLEEYIVLIIIIFDWKCICRQKHLKSTFIQECCLYFHIYAHIIYVGTYYINFSELITKIWVSLSFETICHMLLDVSNYLKLLDVYMTVRYLSNIIECSHILNWAKNNYKNFERKKQLILSGC